MNVPLKKFRFDCKAKTWVIKIKDVLSFYISLPKGLLLTQLSNVEDIERSIMFTYIEHFLVCRIIFQENDFQNVPFCHNTILYNYQ